MTNEALPSGTSNAPPSNTPVPVLYRYTNGQQTWKTWLGGPGVHEADGLSASPDLNGDLAYSESAKMYGAYFVVTDYTGWAQGHYGDSIQYVSDNGTLVMIPGASSSWGCSHNTGIAFEAADEPPLPASAPRTKAPSGSTPRRRECPTTGSRSPMRTPPTEPRVSPWAVCPAATVL